MSSAISQCLNRWTNHRSRMVNRHQNRLDILHNSGSYYYWYGAGDRAQSTASGGNAQTRTSSTQGNNGGYRNRLRSVPGYSYFRSLKWFPIPLALGFALLAYQHYGRVLRRAQKGQKTTEEDAVGQDWEITCYRKFPWKGVSRTWGWVNNITLPEWTRGYILGCYASAFQCALEEAEMEDLRSYKNLGEFFRRSLKSGMRPIDENSPIVSPADGTIFHLGKVNCGVIEQVKGVRYSLRTFLGPATWNNSPNYPTGNSVTKPTACDTNTEYGSHLLQNEKDNCLFYSVVYLAPGDYHRFHSPAEWQVQFRRHFTGELLSVHPAVANWIGGLFSLNERAAYVGQWKHGFFSMTAVGATNVGSIRVYQDPTLQTNVKGLAKNMQIDHQFDVPITLQKGECFGEFNLGSTIVIIFEAPKDFEFSLERNRRIKVGQGMFDPNLRDKRC